jgi:hypothetical protein
MPECQSRHVGSWVIRVSFDDVRVTSAFLPIAGGGIAKLAALRIVQKQIFAVFIPATDRNALTRLWVFCRELPL